MCLLMGYFSLVCCLCFIVNTMFFKKNTRVSVSQTFCFTFLFSLILSQREGRTQKTTTVTTTSKTTSKPQHIQSTSTYLVSAVIDRAINMLSKTNSNSDNVVICDCCACVSVTVYQIRSLFVGLCVHMRV